MGGGAPGPAVAAAPYGYDDDYYDNGYTDYGYAYGPSAYIYANPRFTASRMAGTAGRAGMAAATGLAAPAAAGPDVRAALRRSSAADKIVAALPDRPRNWQRPGTGIGARRAHRRRRRFRSGGGGGFAAVVAAPAAVACRAVRRPAVAEQASLGRWSAAAR